MNTANLIGAVVLVLATILGTAFMVVYSRRGNWWNPDPEDPHGEHRAHLGYFTFNLTLTFWVYDFRLLFDPAIFAWVRTVLFTAIMLNVGWRLWLLVRPERIRA